jgi:hypothetical protein
VLLAVSAPVDCEPLTALPPDQAPEAVQEVALAADQVKVELLPAVTVLGLAAMVTVGAGEVTETVDDCVALPPLPVQVSEKVALALSTPVDCEPLAAWLPDQAPEAVHEVAFVDDQLNVEALPLATVLGLAVKLTVGAAPVTETVADCVALPPVPVQVSTYVVLALSAPLDCEPLIALLPDQPPEAVQDVALVDDHVSFEAPPLATVLGLALKPTVAVGCALTATVADWIALPPAPVQLSV